MRKPEFNEQTGVLQTGNKYPLWCLCLMVPERILPPTSVRGALLSQVTLMGCPLSPVLLWHGNGRQRPLWGEERDLCAGLLFPGSLPVRQRPRASRCAARRTMQPSSPPQSAGDKGDVPRSPPICWCCLPDVLIPPDKLGNTFIPNRRVACDNKVELSSPGVKRCCQAFCCKGEKKSFQDAEFKKKIRNLNILFEKLELLELNMKQYWWLMSV